MNGSTGPVLRVMYAGVPYYIDTANHAYAYGLEGPRLHIGEYNPATERVTLITNWNELFEPRIVSYRNSQATTRLRNDPTTKPQRTRKATVSKKATQT